MTSTTNMSQAQIDYIAAVEAHEAAVLENCEAMSEIVEIKKTDRKQYMQLKVPIQAKLEAAYAVKRDAEDALIVWSTSKVNKALSPEQYEVVENMVELAANNTEAREILIDLGMKLEA